MSAKTKQVGKRAVWGLDEEQALLELFEKARQDPDARTGRGVKAKTWEDITVEVNKRFKCGFQVDQIKSKYARLLMEYELFKESGGEEGPMTAGDWDKLIATRPEHASRFRQFKENGCPHTEICRRIIADKVKLTDSNSTGQKPREERKPRAKRSTRSYNVLPEPKKACIEVGHSGTGWSLMESKLLLFLCWRAKNDRHVFGEEGLKPQGWTDVTTELNEHTTANFSEKEIKDMYVELMQRYQQYKSATGFSGDIKTNPKDEMDWERLIRERPGHYAELEKLKDAGGFPHVEVCSLIKGDTEPNGMGPASINDYLVTGAVQNPVPAPTPSQVQTSAHAVASAQASLSANALSYLLPATANLVTSMVPPAANGQAATADQGGATGTPAVFSQQLHDNLNMFLKTATAYLVMLINDHNQEREL
ncbi:hypothetical protein PHMEG_0001025 [Phytophthora megakarya]|uniref:Myb/SANT-like domain-containing protein n=1 Tax=Phytophthora megakarya TaxID=4795 RepID=A0A225X442_9STRA|nr:hypothetical protein PHMEG_0001025 [Phytophthora megakarya]